MDLQILETKGIELKNGKTVYGTLVSLIRDNLGACFLCGMVESFSATHYCRVCLSDKNECQTMCAESKSIVFRDLNNYKQHCSEALLSKSNNSNGVKFYSIINDLHYFSLFKSTTVDIMHDVLEGIAQM